MKNEMKPLPPFQVLFIIRLCSLLLSCIVFSCDSHPPAEVCNAYSDAVRSYMEGDSEEALRKFESIYKKYPDFTANSQFYGRVLFYTGRYREAAACLEEIEDGLNVDSTKILARCYLRQGEIRHADALLSDILEYSSEDPELLYLMARCRIEEGEIKEALALLTVSVSLMERQIEIPLELASLYSRFGLSSRAASLVERYMDVLDEDHPLRTSLESLHAELQAKEKARL